MEIHAAHGYLLHQFYHHCQMCDQTIMEEVLKTEFATRSSGSNFTNRMAV
jgi:hypothetical protein